MLSNAKLARHHRNNNAKQNMGTQQDFFCTETLPSSASQRHAGAFLLEENAMLTKALRHFKNA